MSPRARMTAIVAVAAAVAAGTAVGATLLTGRDDERRVAPRPRSGNPPLVLDLGARRDGEAAMLRRAARLYAGGEYEAAHRLFVGARSPEAEVGAALSTWPEGSIAELQRLGQAYPRNGAVQVNLGLALYWAGREREAVAAWRAAEQGHADSPYAVRADDFLHPRIAPGLPPFVAGFDPPASVTRLPPSRQLAVLARRARAGGVRAKLLYGIALQRVGRPRSAARVFAAAAALDPRSAEAQVAAAVGRFDKDDPSRAFSRLGPLVRRFPRAATVRFHLGLLLYWIGDVQKGRRQLRRASAVAPRSPVGRAAKNFLARLEEASGR